MPTRTFKFYGQGWGDQTTEISLTFNGQPVYQGPVPTVAQRPPTAPGVYTPVLLCTGGALDVEASGAFPMSVTVTAGNLLFSDLESNYVSIPNPVFSPEQWAIIQADTDQAAILQIIYSLANPPFTDEEKALLENLSTSSAVIQELRATHGVGNYVSGPDYFSPNFWPSDSRSNVVIDGQPQSTPDPRPEGLTGDWTWDIATNQTLVCDVDVLAGTP